MIKKAVCLLSGGLDSTTCLYEARQKGFEVRALTISYGQLHEKEVECARQITANLEIDHHVISISMPWKGSALLDSDIPVPTGRRESEMAENIPATYVPARNSIFLSFAASWAEVLGAEAIFFGVNIQDYSGYPDCRPEYLQAFMELIRLGTKQGNEGKMIRIEAPLLKLSKKEIVLRGKTLDVPFQKTWSCYQGKEIPCGECDSCVLRAKGFREAGLEDPLIHHAISSLG